LNLTGASAALTAYLLGAGAGALIGGFLTNQHKISSNRVVALCLTFAAVMAAILASQVLSGYWAVVLMCLMGLGTGVAAPSRDIMIRGATVAKLGKKSFGRVYGFTYCGMDVGQSLTPIFFVCLQLFFSVLQFFRPLRFLQRFASRLSQVRRRPKEAEA